jgi:hypothetical protein
MDEKGGRRFENCDRANFEYPGHLTGFSSLWSQDNAKKWSGTIVRLPLRTSASDFGDAVGPDELLDKFTEFASGELAIILLFLRHVTSIELRVVSAEGPTNIVAKASINKPVSEWRERGEYGCRTYVSTIQIVQPSESDVNRKEWLIGEVVSYADVASILSERLGVDATAGLRRNKLKPSVALAFRRPDSPDEPLQDGRLFAGLPLPIQTQLPCHIDALFALMRNRQALVNDSETGISSSSDHR